MKRLLVGLIGFTLVSIAPFAISGERDHKQHRDFKDGRKHEHHQSQNRDHRKAKKHEHHRRHDLRAHKFAKHKDRHHAYRHHKPLAHKAFKKSRHGHGHHDAKYLIGGVVLGSLIHELAKPRTTVVQETVYVDRGPSQVYQSPRDFMVDPEGRCYSIEYKENGRVLREVDGSYCF